MSGKIVVVGSINTDMVIKADRLPTPGETVLGGEFFMFPGGKGANQAVAAARLGGNVTFLANAGNDLFGEQAIRQFQRESIDTTYIGRDPDKPSGIALIGIDQQGENSILVASGANASLSEADIDRAEQVIRAAEVVLVQLETPLTTVYHLIHRCAAWGVRLILNPAPSQVLPNEIYKQLFAITPNETETEVLTGIRVVDEASALQAANVLRGRGVGHIIITLGVRGAFVYTEHDSYLVAPPEVVAIDTTAAGDVFSGAFAVGIAEGLAVANAVSFACQAAAISTTRMGAQTSSPYRDELRPQNSSR